MQNEAYSWHFTRRNQYVSELCGTATTSPIEIRGFVRSAAQDISGVLIFRTITAHLQVVEAEPGSASGLFKAGEHIGGELRGHTPVKPQPRRNAVDGAQVTNPPELLPGRQGWTAGHQLLHACHADKMRSEARA